MRTCRTSVIFSNSSNNLKLSIEPNKPIKSIKVFSAKKNDQEVNIELLFFKENGEKTNDTVKVNF